MEQIEIERIFLEFIRQHWRANMPCQLERGVWVSWHEAISSDEYEANTPVRKAWFITDRQIEARPALSFKLFAENRVQAGANDMHEMGEANIAPFRESGDFYVAMISAPLHGGAFRAGLVNSCVINKGRIWSA